MLTCALGNQCDTSIKPVNVFLALWLVVVSKHNCGPVAQLVEHWAVTREVVSSTPAGPTLRVLK